MGATAAPQEWTENLLERGVDEQFIGERWDVNKHVHDAHAAVEEALDDLKEEVGHALESRKRGSLERQRRSGARVGIALKRRAFMEELAAFEGALAQASMHLDAEEEGQR